MQDIKNKFITKYVAQISTSPSGAMTQHAHTKDPPPVIVVHIPHNLGPDADRGYTYVTLNIRLAFHYYIDTGKHETNLNVLDKYGHLDLETYSGQLHFNVPEKKMGLIDMG
ncbi:hypothetical protein CHS0354_033075 [Potamilus streckersoni]|uniref:Uncharacterized protein n=1 Tax=Potamilus streckersoni TaxID=2493646 RepID=A0AAE0TBD6_9BIVA|nr:hypothetical protein CHS0354_033075 [Potamilus streckersoni]